MGTFRIIQQKLESFIKKYYTNELIRGAILFLAIGLLYLLITLLVEYFLWLNSFGRKLLFWTFILVESALFVRFIAFPLTKLFKFRKGINHDEASRIIGHHFPEVSDKLLNVIQLGRNKEHSDLLAASIDQKASELQPIPFANAIRFRENLKYLKYVAIPILLFLLISTLGDSNIFSSSYTRVVNYDVAYDPPAPFSFVVRNKELYAIENTAYTLKVRTDGLTVPQNVSILYNDQVYYMQQLAPGEFEYTFQEPIDPVNFHLKSNKLQSREYTLDVIKTPSLADFEMELNFPRHTSMETRTIKSTGNATIPEGTQVNWKVAARNTEEIHLKTDDSLFSFTSQGDNFEFQNTIFRKLDYTVTTSNERLKEYENLSYSLQVVKDEYPQIDVQSKKDSTDIERVLFLGNVSDDYGLTKLQLVYYPSGEEENAKTETLPVSTSNFDEFSYDFPGDLPLEDGVSYEYYFQVSDNDAIHNFKSSKSGLYYFRKLTQREIESEQLDKQSETIQNLDQSFQKLQENKESFEELSRTQKEKTELNYNDKKKLESFLQRQRQQEEMMRNFSEQMKEELEEFQSEEEEDHFKEELKERLEENEKRLEENEKLLEELEKLQEKIEQEDLIQRLDNLSKERKKQERNLEQLVELTKRFYVKKKAEKIADELQHLGEKQEDISTKDESENTKEAQEELNEAFEELMEELDKLQEENEGLKSPMVLPEDQNLEEEIQTDQEDATQQLEDGKPEDASPSQQKAGEKMKQMGQSIKAEMQGGEMDTLEEDIEMLRQILSNLIVFSFEQEEVMLDFRDADYGGPNYSEKLIVQNELKINFEHIDDSLYALSVRQPVIGDDINSILTDVSYNLDKSLDQLSQNKSNQGLRNQQYVMTGANDLAVLLDGLLSNLNMQLDMASGAGSGEGKPSPGSGGGKFQLPDIIKSQEELIEEMQGMGESEGEGEGESQEGEGGESGEGEGNSGSESEGDGDGEGSGQNSGQDQGEGEGEGQGEGEGEGHMNDEGMSGELFEIYKQQQKLRQELENLIKEEGLGGNAGDLLKDMMHIEQQLLERGVNKGTTQDMLLLKYELLKLEDAFYQQGEEEKREATTNRDEFKNTKRMSEAEIKSYFNTTEILNRDALPLRNNYRIKVRQYFKNRND